MGVIIFGDNFAELLESEDYDTHLIRDQVLKKIFDPDHNGWRAVGITGPSLSYGSNLDDEQIWELAYDSVANGIRVVEVEPLIGTVSSRQDYDQIMQDVFDEDLNALRIAFGATERAYTGWKPCDVHVFQTIHLPDDHALSIKDIEDEAVTTGSRLDGEQIIMKAFDTSTGKLVLVG